MRYCSWLVLNGIDVSRVDVYSAKRGDGRRHLSYRLGTSAIPEVPDVCDYNIRFYIQLTGFERDVYRDIPVSHLG
jgi:hypothetical protein